MILQVQSEAVADGSGSDGPGCCQCHNLPSQIREPDPVASQGKAHHTRRADLRAQ